MIHALFLGAILLAASLGSRPGTLDGLQSASPAGSAYTSVVFSMQPRAAEPPWQVRLDAGGVGTYSVTGDGVSLPQPITVSAPTMQRLAKGVARVIEGPCATRHKNIATNGRKLLQYITPAGRFTCDFDNSDDDGVMDAANVFQAIAATLQFSAALAHGHRYDRLGLDAELDVFAAEVQGGRAIEVQNAAPALQSIVDDERLMERVRRKAARLLQDAGGPVSPAPPSPSAL